jgi:predicted acetyltransferase
LVFNSDVPANRFQFLDPGPLIDGELELVAPQAQWIDQVLAACAHPLTQVQSPQEARLTRQQIEQFLDSAPGGRESPATASGEVPQQHFWMRLRESYVGAIGSPPIRMLGGISLRIGTNESICLYYGNIGYHVYPPARGRHYAERACRLLLPLVRRYGITTLWITCNPDNFGSRATCERLGASLVDVVAVPASDPLYARGEHFKCRYMLPLGSISQASREI